MRDIKFRAWNGIDNRMVDWSTFKANPDFLMGVIKGVKHYQLMQYAGLKDKNGVEIYEGDLMDGFDGSVKMLIRFSLEDCAFIAESYSSKGSAMINQDYCNNFEVIGNIHQNPELLG